MDKFNEWYIQRFRSNGLLALSQQKSKLYIQSKRDALFNYSGLGSYSKLKSNIEILKTYQGVKDVFFITNCKNPSIVFEPMYMILPPYVEFKIVARCVNVETAVHIKLSL